MPSFKKRAYNGQEYFLDEKKQVLTLSPQYHYQLLDDTKIMQRFKKFGGSSIGNIFQTDAFKSPFLAFCFIARLNLPPLQMKYINAGVALEPKVIEFLQQKFQNDEIKHIEAAEVGYDYFKNDRIIGGVPDGLIPSRKLVLELKAVGKKKRDAWRAGNLPEDYKKQAQLYAYLLGYDYYSIVGTFLEENDYYDYDNVDFEKQTDMFTFKVNKEMAQDDINEVKKFWTNYTQLGISPVYRLPRDNDQVEYLKCHNEEEWRELFNKWKTMGKIDEDINFE
ncbi:MAGa7180 family putative nuclease [Mycoplasmopsis columbina]|uniref:MAGa7180 family putative nuclease n=1 Tax=Mycoplasmopsis columbina TaxID=114881 RepID=UPI0004A6EB4F|nr:hypothetical protein [Mycoplasmopsis columbina]VEU76970.1 Uncharacterised protein [Mycoplasmopsis columbina]